MEYFLNLKETKIEKQYEYEQVIKNIDLETIFNMPLRDAYDCIKNELLDITEVKTNLLLDIHTNTEFEDIDLYLINLLIHIVIEILLTKSTNSEYKDYLAIPHKLETQILGTEKDIVELVNSELPLERLQIRIIAKDNENGFKFVERII